MRNLLKARENMSEREKFLTDLFEAHYDRLVYFCLQMTKDEEQARDIVQDAFISYWQQHKTVDQHPSVIKRFLYNSVRNASLNYLRHRKVVLTHQNTLAPEESESSVMEHIITAEVLGYIHDSLHSLGEPYRNICVKAFMEGMKNQEIADELGISINTVKKQKQKAIELLRIRLTAEFLISSAIFLSTTTI